MSKFRSIADDFYSKNKNFILEKNHKSFSLFINKILKFLFCPITCLIGQNKNFDILFIMRYHPLSEISPEVELQLLNDLKNCEVFSLALDESTNIQNKSQMAVSDI